MTAHLTLRRLLLIACALAFPALVIAEAVTG
jgi:hypothetical protein